MATTYRSKTTRASSSTIAHDELASLLKHLTGYGLELVQIVVQTDRYHTTLSANIPSRELDHLNLEVVP